MSDYIRFSMKITPVVVTAKDDADGQAAFENVDTRLRPFFCDSKHSTDIQNVDYQTPDGGGTNSSTSDAFDANKAFAKHLSSDTQGCAGINGHQIWIKNTGYKYNATKPANIDKTAKTEEEFIYLHNHTNNANTSTRLTKLYPGDAFYLQYCLDSYYSLEGDGTSADGTTAVEFVIFT